MPSTTNSIDTDRIPLEVTECALAVGEHSVGFPLSRTGNQLIEAYLKLITLVRKTRPDYLRAADVDALSTATGLDRSFIKNRVATHLAALPA